MPTALQMIEQQKDAIHSLEIENAALAKRTSEAELRAETVQAAYDLLISSGSMLTKREEVRLRLACARIGEGADVPAGVSDLLDSWCDVILDGTRGGRDAG